MYVRMLAMYVCAFDIFLQFSFTPWTNIAFHFCLVRGPSADFLKTKKGGEAEANLFALEIIGWRNESYVVKVKLSECFIVLYEFPSRAI